MRTRPRRETRGVSRSKCGDLITACVPVSWATSIIVNESTDALDLVDGFGTTELVIGIRAYQWGWEYYYPKDLDLNYNIKKNYSAFIGNSVKYSYSANKHLQANKFFKFYQNKQFDFSVVPAQILFSSLTKSFFFNFLNWNDFGSSSLSESNIFKKNTFFFKTNKDFLFSNYSETDRFHINLHKLYFNSNSYLNSLSFMLKRQQTFFNKNSYLTNSSFFLNKKNFDKFIKINLNWNDFNNKNLIEIKNNYQILNFTFFNLIFKNFWITKNFFNNFFFFSKTKINNFNLFIDKNQLNFPFLKFFNKSFSFTDINKAPNFFFFNENSYSLNYEFLNQTRQNNVFKLFSSAESILFNQRSLRKIGKTPLNVFQQNLLQTNSNMTTHINFMQNMLYINNTSFFFWHKSNFFNFYLFDKLGLNKIALSYPHSPVIYPLTNKNQLMYDYPLNSKISNLPLIFQGKEEFMPWAYKTTYWNFFFNDINFNKRLTYNTIIFKKDLYSYFPTFIQFYDYNFKNNQNLNLLENYFWDTTLLPLSYDEYLNCKDNFFGNLLYDPNAVAFSAFNKFFRYLDQIVYENIENENDEKEFSYSNFFFNDFSLFNTYLTPLINFNFIATSSDVFDFEDTYEFFKFLNFNIKQQKLFLNINNFNWNNFSYFLVANNFRSNYQSFNFFNDNGNFFLNNFYFNFYFDFKQNNIFNLILQTKLNMLNRNEQRYLKFLINLDNFFLTNQLDLTNSTQFSFKNDYYLNLRNTTKNLIVNYNSLQKIFRARLDENRSFASFKTLSNSHSYQFNLTTSKPIFDKFLAKNKTNFFKTNFFKTNFNKNFNELTTALSLNNFSIFKFPFLMSYKVDSAKYIWLDWFSRWHFVEIQPASSSKYAIHGMPYTNKPFEYTSNQNEILNESEAYGTRLMRARRNYLPNYTYNPFLNKKNNIWFKINFFSEKPNFCGSNLKQFKKNLNYLNNFWNNYEKSFFQYFTPSISNMNSYAKSLWRPTTSISNYYYNVSNLFDILTKREYLYRQFLLNTNYIVSLTKELTNNPSNTFITEIKTILLNTNTILFNNEYSKLINYYTINTHFFNLIEKTLISSFPFNKIQKWIKEYFFNTKITQLNSNTINLYKNQFRPLRKGVNNMLRLHATGAIAMPTEIRLQILASSKDVIHSWAVPSAGIKIDCVPGYSSHKVMIFLISGIFWGQCMEICGRYHHWMPIVVYFMKRDLFFLWCTHFVFLNSSNNTLLTNDKQFINTVKTVSVDKNAWISELFI